MAIAVVHVGENLRRLRTLNALTQEQLAERAGLTRSAVQRAERDLTEPHMTTLRKLADALGVALQLTNILRDVREDRHNGRIYLPQEDLDRFGCTLALDAAGNLADPSDRFAALIRFEAARARGWYDTGLRLLPMLDHRSAACTAAMAGIYRRLLDKITAAPAAVTTSRLSLSGPAKLAVAVRAVTVARV